MSTEGGSVAARFLIDVFSASTAQPIYLSSLKNADARDNEPGERHVVTRNTADIEAFVRKWDRPNRGLYFCVSTVALGAQTRSKETVAELTGLHADIDLNSVEETRVEVWQILQQLESPPSKIIASGHGFHCYWYFRESLKKTDENVAKVEQLLRALCRHLGGDPQVCEVSRLMRLPGSHNSKSGEWIEVTIADDRPTARYEPKELAEWLANTVPVITRKPAANGKSNGHDSENPFLDFAAGTTKPPIDVDGRLAAKRYQGPGETSIHATQLQVSASLLGRGHPIDEVVDTIFSATCAAAGAAGNRWDWTKEQQDIRTMCETWLAKHPEIKQSSEGNKGIDDNAGTADGANQEGEQHKTAKPKDVVRALDEWDAGEDTGPIPPRGWLLGNQFCRKFVSSLIGAGATGKSALRMLQYFSLVTGRALTGQHVFRRGRVLLLSFEDDREELRRRIKAVLIHYKIGHEDIKGWLFCASPKGLKFAEMQKGSRQAGQLEKVLRDAIERRKPDLVALDPFVKTHGLEENDNSAMDFVCDLIAKLSIEYDIAIDSPHHTKKGRLVAGDADAGRGASSSRDAWRLVYTLTQMSEDEAKTFDISEVDRRAYIRLDSSKVNIAPSAQKATWFHLVGVPLGNGTPEYPHGDEVQTVEPWVPPDTWANLSTVALNAALTEIDNGLPNGQRFSGAASAKDRAAWRIVWRHCPGKSETQCRQIINAWMKTGLLLSEKYNDPIERKERDGLRVDNTKRPT
jgi:AAA domain/RepB DNA-primase from phage plasmid